MQPKKSLGQNFLRDENVLAQIIESANLSADDNVIEIGPGEGVLTDELIKKVGKVIAIEKDDKLAEKLKKKYKNNKKLEIIAGDILKINLPEIINSQGSTFGILKVEPWGDYKLIANIPYYITSPIIRLFLETVYPPKEMILMVQKEVAERICAKPGQMSILAVSIQYYAQPELLFYVDKKSFWPEPEVDSAIIRIEVRSKKKEEGCEEKNKFFQIVKAGFSAKRKTLLNNLSTSLHLSRQEVEEKLKKVGIGLAQRAQELSVEDWKKLSEVF